MHNTDDAKFMDDVLKRSYGAPVVVMFHSPTCGPCASMKPMIERLATELGFLLVGVDASRNRGLVTSESVRAVPTMMIYKNGKQHGSSLAGAKTEPVVRSYLHAHGVAGA